MLKSLTSITSVTSVTSDLPQPGEHVLDLLRADLGVQQDGVLCVSGIFFGDFLYSFTKLQKQFRTTSVTIYNWGFFFNLTFGRSTVNYFLKT